MSVFKQLFPPKWFVMAVVATGSGCVDGTDMSADRDAGDVLLRRTEDPSDLPIKGLSDEEQAQFAKGDALFELMFREGQGLGPLYIRRSCASCHVDDGKGPGFVDKFSTSNAAPYGTTVRPFTTTTDAIGVMAPVDAFLSRRIGPAVFGRGFMEAVDESAVIALAATQAIEGRVHGVVPRVTFHSQKNDDARVETPAFETSNLLGRFGLKSRIATIDDFVADAFQGDMGLTSPMRPNELENPNNIDDDDRAGVDLDLDTVNAVADYVRFLDIPARTDFADDDHALFIATGCADCHVESLPTAVDYPVAALADIMAPLFTDMLLHDTGDELADFIVDEAATERQWRTAPLIGMRFLPNFMHDGRAATIHEAILAHDGEGSDAAASVDSYRALSDDDQERLAEMVGGL